MLVLQLPAPTAGSSRQQRQGRNTAPGAAEELYSKHFTLNVQPYGKGEWKLSLKAGLKAGIQQAEVSICFAIESGKQKRHIMAHQLFLSLLNQQS